MNFKLINVAWRLSIKSSSRSLRNERFNYKLFLLCLPAVGSRTRALKYYYHHTHPTLATCDKNTVKIKCIPPQSTQLQCRRASLPNMWLRPFRSGLSQFFSPSVLALRRLMQILAQINNHYANIFMSCQPEFSLRSLLPSFILIWTKHPRVRSKFAFSN